METTKTDRNIKLILPFSHFLFLLTNTSDIPGEENAVHKSQAEQEYVILTDVSHECVK